MTLEELKQNTDYIYCEEYKHHVPCIRIEPGRVGGAVPALRGRMRLVRLPSGRLPLRKRQSSCADTYVRRQVGGKVADAPRPLGMPHYK